MKRNSVVIIIGVLVLTSCDCFQIVTGTVIDKETGKPIQRALVYNKNKDWNKTLTDSIGHFELSNVSGGFCCPPMTVIIEKDNYKQEEVSIPAGGQKTIEFKKHGNNSKTDKTIELMQGVWFHEKDSLAFITVKQNQWTFNYDGKQTVIADNFSIQLADKLPEFVNEKGNFFILTNTKDTLKYEILGLTDSLFSMMYFPAGKIHLYKRRK